MRPSESVAAFESFAEGNGISLIGITPREGVAQIVAFFEAIPATGCDGPSGDMLLFQWGTYDWGEGKNFELNITRQFIESEVGDEDAISQLQLTFAFPPTIELANLGEGNRWCEGRDQLDAFREYVLSCQPLRAVAGRDPPRVSLTHSYV